MRNTGLKAMGVHDGHRKRLKNRFITHGLDSFEDHNALELLLFYAKPQGDLNELAHDLINRFGSFSAVFDAPYEELMKVSGIKEHSATLIKLVTQISRRYQIAKQKNDTVINSTDKAGQFMVPYFYGERDEVVYMLCLDAKCKLISCKLLFRGDVNSADISARKIVENALLYNSTSVILAHNHTSGVALPSREDQDTTRRFDEALRAVDIILADHIIVADGDFVSMADNGFFR